MMQEESNKASDSIGQFISVQKQSIFLSLFYIFQEFFVEKMHS